MVPCCKVSYTLCLQTGGKSAQGKRSTKGIKVRKGDQERKTSKCTNTATHERSRVEAVARGAPHETVLTNVLEILSLLGFHRD